MNQGRPVFAQLMEFLPHQEFQRCVKRYNAQKGIRTFSCWDQFLCMAFAQLTHRESLRDIESCLRSVESKLYHLGIRGRVSRSTLAEANEDRPWQIYADLAQTLIGIARPLYASETFGVDLHNTVYAFDATTIELCLALSPWASFQRSCGGIKLHTQLWIFVEISQRLSIFRRLDAMTSPFSISSSMNPGPSTCLTVVTSISSASTSFR